MAIDSAARRQVALLDQVVLFPDGSLANAQDRAWMQKHYFDPTGAPPPPFEAAGGSIHDELNAELYFSTVAVASKDDLTGFNVALGGRPYLIDVRKYQRATLTASAPQQDTGAEAAERSLSREGFWLREQIDWRHGAGQRFFDAEGSDRARFEMSKGTDPWTPYKLALLPDTAKKLNATASNVNCFEVGGFLYVVDGNFLRFTADPTVETPAFTSVDTGFPITDVTTDGDRIYIAQGSNGLRVTPVGSGAAPTVLGASTPALVQFANGRLIGANDNLLYEISSTGTTTVIRTDPRTGWVWTAVAGHPQAIFAAGRANGRSEVYATVSDNVTTALSPPTFACHLPFGETVNAMESYAQLIILGTTAGLRVATVATKNLDYGEVIAITGGVSALSPHGKFCWFGWTNFDGATTGIGRADLSHSTSAATFVPAYASDLMAHNLSGTVQGVATHNSRRYFVVAGSGLWGETQYKVPSGTWDSGQIRYSTLTPKLFTGVDLRSEPLMGQAGAQAIAADGTVRTLGIATGQGTTENSLGDAQGSGVSMSLRLILERDISDPTEGPEITGWVLSALARPKRVTEFIVPVILKSLVTNLVNAQVPFDVLDEIRRLEELARSSELVTYQEGDANYTVRVDSVAVAEADVRSWIEDRGDETLIWYEATVMVRLLSKEA